MKRYLFLSLILITAVSAFAQERVDLWPELAPGETERSDPVDANGDENFVKVTTPYLLFYRPEVKKTDMCILAVPGGGYTNCYYYFEVKKFLQEWLNQGVTVAVLVYRVPRPESGPIYTRAWQDVQRAIRVIRANAERYGINPDRIGAHGDSAGGHLTMMAAAASQTPAYEPVDEIDNLPCHLNFAISVYAAYTLDDGAQDANLHGGIGARLLTEDLRFDEKTPPICLIHGDNDVYSPLGSIEIYRKLHEMKIPCELHIYQGVGHNYYTWEDKANASTWLDRCVDWVKSINMY